MTSAMFGVRSPKCEFGVPSPKCECGVLGAEF
jgi:hypothetical protein